MIEYSIIIRTTGMAGDKYKRLLKSIDKLEPKPVEVIVVLPIGYKKPEEQLGYETFYFAPKGMVSQRIYGVMKCNTKYALICDDDVCFDSDFVRKLHKPIEEGKSEISAGPLLSFLPKKGINTAIDMISGAAAPTIFNKGRYCTILATTGYSYDRNINTNIHEYMEAESLPWTCFYAEVDALKRIKLGDEIWLDAHGYAALDDQTMFYKAKLLGIRTIVVSDAFYEHLDAKTSTRNSSKVSIYSSAFNRVVFWHRFIYSMKKSIVKKIYARVCFYYRLLWILIFDLIYIFRKRMTSDEFNIRIKGFREGWRYVKSAEYLALSNLK